ncbi:uroporphyrinogen decarboxylase family protein [Chloroflexota bacterium]
MATRVTPEQALIKKSREEIEKKTGKSPEQLYEEREKRITDVIQMKVPDRMPVFLRLGYFPIKYAGLSPSTIFYDSAAYQNAVVKTLLDFEPDFFTQRYGNFSGPNMEQLGSKQYQWPGGPLRSDQHAQFIEIEIMEENEYDLFITDPGDFILRYYLPRAYGALAPLAKLPPLRSLVGSSALPTQTIRFSSPDIIQAFEAIFKSGQEQAKFGQWHQKIHDDMGIPPLSYPGGGVATPFDFLTDHLRGERGIAVDMFRRPEKIFAAMEKVLEWHLARMAPPDPSEKGKRRVGGGGSHWGDAAFLSRKQFDTFYWPTWKKSMLAAIDMGYIPVMGCEGNYDDRLECFLELPKGKVLFHNQSQFTDVVRAKEILGDHMAFMGGVPASLLWGGSPQEVEEHCKNLIKVVGKGGGFILSCGGVEDDAKPANLKAMVDAIKKYGRY